MVELTCVINEVVEWKNKLAIRSLKNYGYSELQITWVIKIIIKHRESLCKLYRFVCAVDCIV